MLKNKGPSSKKKALLARKEQILQDLQYYEARIKEYTTATKPASFNCSSSDSEDDAPYTFRTLEVVPTLSKLKEQDQLLRTRLRATEELTGLAVLQSEVIELAQDPVIQGDNTVFEPGVWREVTAECRIDLVPFYITFKTQQPSRRFAATHYRDLHVVPVKKAQETELAKSVLSALTRPSDAIEVLRSYASAYRSRRTTLVRLSDMYTNLSLEPLSDGGFVVKFPNLLSISWRLENKLSAVAAFHHKTSFDFEYLDESYLKRIKIEYKKLSNPSLQTDERTFILRNIITICLEAQMQAQDTYESMESDQESLRRPDKTTLSEDIDKNEDIDRRKTDKEVMAPPKTIPKKAKPKRTENTDDNRKSTKRASEADDQNAKKVKKDVHGRGKSITDMVKEKDMTEGNKNNVNKTTDKKQMNHKGNGDVVDKDQDNQKSDDKEQKKQTVSEKAAEKKQMYQKKSDKVLDKPHADDKRAQQSTKQDKVVAKNVEKLKSSDKSNKHKNTERIDKNSNNKTGAVQKQSKVADKNEKQKIDDVEQATDKIEAKKSKNAENNPNKVENKEAEHAKNTKDNAKSQPKSKNKKDLNSEKEQNSDTNAKNATSNVPNTKNHVEKGLNPKTVVNTDTTTKDGQNDQENKNKNSKDPKKTVTQNAKITKKVNTEKEGKENKNDNRKTDTKKDKAPTQKPKELNAQKHQTTTEKTKILPKNNPKIFQSEIVDTENKMADSKNKMADPKNKMIDPKNKMDEAKNKVKPKMVLPNHRSSTGGIKKPIFKTLVSKESKIPQKKLSPYAKILQKNPVRVSPRMTANFKSSSATNIQTKVFNPSKPSTNIPRLLKTIRPQSK